MKIACIGNMNNMVFPICRYLYDLDYEVTLFLLDEYEHFLPNADADNVNINIVDLGWNEETFSNVSKEKIISIFNGYDFFIGTDYSAAYLSKGGIRMDIYMPVGSDLFLYPFKTFNSWLPKTWEIEKYKCARNQLWGIRQAKNLSCDITNELIEDIFIKIKPVGKRIAVLPLLYLKNGTYPSAELPNNLVPFLKHFEASKFAVMQHCRQSWEYAKQNPHYKANDKLIKGFEEFSKDKNGVMLVLLEYGEHVENSKTLIAELGIDNRVIWLPKMLRKHLMHFINLADMSVGELGNSWLSYGAVHEALACKVPFMGYRKDELYNTQYKELYSMINVATPEEVADRLEYYYHNREELATMGEQGHDWLLNYAINPSVQKVLEIIKNHKGRKKLPIDWKLVFMQPYFIFIRIYNVFAIKFTSK